MFQELNKEHFIRSSLRKSFFFSFALKYPGNYINSSKQRRNATEAQMSHEMTLIEFFTITHSN